ncbi:MAG: sigma-54 dependent transcriptional regulator [bacterium]
MTGKILVVDDEKNILKSVAMTLSEDQHIVFTCGNVDEAVRLLEREQFDAALVDILMPDVDGMEFLRMCRDRWRDMQVVMMSGHGTISTAVEATKLGAYDFLEKPLSREKLLLTVQRVLEFRRLERENLELRSQVAERHRIVGRSVIIRELIEKIQRIGPTNSRVLVRGENGTGKELVARALHAASQRADKPFVKVNCAAIPHDLIESELFGHEKGAFTGAISMRRGKFELAHRGTIFLDEIGDMHLDTQAKVLRVLEENEFERVGGAEVIRVDVRVITATNKDLEKEIEKGNFREDLYYRLDVIPFRVPSLRERREDIPLLAAFFLDQFQKEYGGKKRTIAQDAMNLLCEYSWHGNVRELRNLIERIYIMSSREIITAEELEMFMPSEPVESNEPLTLREVMNRSERDFIMKTLRENNFNVTETAKQLKIERSHLYKKIRTHGITLP